MFRTAAACAVVSLAGSAAIAGGIERTTQSVGILFEEGNRLELSFGRVTPDVSGTATAFSPTPGGSSGDMTEDYFQFGAAYKRNLNERLSMAVIYDQPFGASVSYPSGQPYFAAGSEADLTTHAITGLLKYTTDSNVSVYGGLRYQTLEAEVSIPAAGYTGNADRAGGWGYVVGAAYERPDIALRVALTYNSKVKHELDTTENGVLNTTTDVETPQSVNLDFQSGIAQDTLVFGSIRWVNWSDFDITPAGYLGATGGSLVSYDDDTVTYNLGVGRRLNDMWSVALSYGWEPSHGGFVDNLGPTNGRQSVTVGATYTQDAFEITGGVSYVWIGDAETEPFVGSFPSARFEDNHAVGAGLKIAYTF